jgi:hypothetical protein
MDEIELTPEQIDGLNKLALFIINKYISFFIKHSLTAYE